MAETDVRPIPLARWTEAAAAWRAGDEFKLVMLATGLLQSELLALEPSEYAKLYEKVQEVNTPFFEFAVRSLAPEALLRTISKNVSPGS